MRHRPKGETLTTADVVTLDTVTATAAIDAVRPTLPEGHVITSVARY